MTENNEAGFQKTHYYNKAIIKLPKTFKIHFFFFFLEVWNIINTTTRGGLTEESSYCICVRGQSDFIITCLTYTNHSLKAASIPGVVCWWQSG